MPKPSSNPTIKSCRKQRTALKTTTTTTRSLRYPAVLGMRAQKDGAKKGQGAVAKTKRISWLDSHSTQPPIINEPSATTSLPPISVRLKKITFDDEIMHSPSPQSLPPIFAAAAAAAASHRMSVNPPFLSRITNLESSIKEEPLIESDVIKI